MSFLSSIAAPMLTRLLSSANATTLEISARNRITCDDGWTYELNSTGATIVSAFDLVCNSAWKLPLLQSMFWFGSFLGGLSSGILADRFGRRITFCLAVVTFMVSNFCQSLATSLFVFLALTTLNGFCIIIHYATGFVLVQELVPKSLRAGVSLAVNMSVAVGFVVLPLVMWVVRDWRWLLRAHTLLFGVLIPLVWFVPESRMWLKQRAKQRDKSTPETIDPVNHNLSSDHDVINDEIGLNDVKKKGNRVGVGTIFTHSELRRRFLLVCLLWNAGVMGFYTLNLNSSNLHGNMYVNCTLSALIDLLAYVITFLFMTKWGRQRATMIATFLGGVLCIITPLLSSVNVMAGVVSALAGKFFFTVVVGVLYLYTTELFPTMIRNTCVGLASSISRLSCMASPFIIFMGERFDLSIPYYVLGTCALFASFIACLLPETANIPLPANLDDAVAMKPRKCSRTFC